MTSLSVPKERIETHLHRLSSEIGARPGGSAGNREAAEYIREVFERSGLDVEMQEFACPVWTAHNTRLDVNGVYLDAVANSFSPACDVQAPAVTVGTVSELESAELDGRVAVLYGDLVRNPLSPKSWFLISERDAHVIQLLEEKAPSAVVTVQQRPAELERLIEDPDFHIPSATVPVRDGLTLLRKADPIIRLRIDSTRAPGRTWNVIGRRSGASEERIVLCAHYDTKFDTPGALDNGGGVAVLLSLAQQLAPRCLQLGLEFIAFGNEENVPEGTEVYIREHAAHLDEIVALFNFDGVGHALDVNTISALAHSEPVRELVESLIHDEPELAWAEPWLESNHGLFAWRGVPCLAFTSPASRHLSHLRCDTPEWVNSYSLVRLAEFATSVVDRLQGVTAKWTRPTTD